MAQQKTKPKEVRKPSMLSEERIVDSDSDGQGSEASSPEDSVPRQPASIQTPAKKKQQPTKRKHKAHKPNESPEVDSGAEAVDAVETEASEDVSEESDASSSGEAKRSAPSTNAAPPKKKTKPAAPSAIAPKPFELPNGFEKVRFSNGDYASDSTTFLTEDLSRKQVWHITAPAFVEIKNVKPFSIQDVQSGKPIFSKNGVDYGFLTGLHKMERLLLASGESMEYSQAGARISGTYHLREIGRVKTTKDAGTDKENAGLAFAATSTPPPRKPREQPSGLRMRYQPYGSSLNVPRDRSLTGISSSFRTPVELPQSQLERSEKKQKRKQKQKQELNLEHTKESQDNDTMETDLAASSAVKNPTTGKPSESARKMVEKAFNAASETPAKEKKRKKKKHKLADEASA